MFALINNVNVDWAESTQQTNISKHIQMKTHEFANALSHKSVAINWFAFASSVD